MEDVDEHKGPTTTHVDVASRCFGGRLGKSVEACLLFNQRVAVFSFIAAIPVKKERKAGIKKSRTMLGHYSEKKGEKKQRKRVI